MSNKQEKRRRRAERERLMSQAVSSSLTMAVAPAVRVPAVPVGGQPTISPPSNVNLAGREVVLTGREVADLLKVSRATFFRLVKAGRIPGRIDEPGLPVRYLRSAVVSWLESAAVGLGRPQAESGRTAQPAGCGA